MAITLKPEYLDTLAVGEHTITVLYNDGEADGTFAVAGKATDGEQTGDTASPETRGNHGIIIGIALLLVLVSGGVVLFLHLRRRNRA